MDWIISLWSFRAWMRLRERGYAGDTIGLVWTLALAIIGSILGSLLALALATS